MWPSEDSSPTSARPGLGAAAARLRGAAGEAFGSKVRLTRVSTSAAAPGAAATSWSRICQAAAGRAGSIASATGRRAWSPARARSPWSPSPTSGWGRGRGWPARRPSWRPSRRRRPVRQPGRGGDHPEGGGEQAGPRSRTSPYRPPYPSSADSSAVGPGCRAAERSGQLGDHTRPGIWCSRAGGELPAEPGAPRAATGSRRPGPRWPLRLHAGGPI